VIVEKRGFRNSPHAPRLCAGKLNSEAVVVVQQADGFAMAGSNDEAARTFFKEIVRHSAVVVEKEPMKMVCGVGVAQTKWRIQLRVMTCIELMAEERDWLQGLELALTHEVLPVSTEPMKKMDAADLPPSVGAVKATECQRGFKFRSLLGKLVFSVVCGCIGISFPIPGQSCSPHCRSKLSEDL
jgi:hypothetical protein